MRRSLLFIPSNNPGMLQNADVFGSDSVIFDLEDAVNVTEKDNARNLLYYYLQEHSNLNMEVVVRINGLDTKHYASQGQQRTVALVVKLSLMEVIKEEIGEYPILLLDDVLSELDSDRQDRLLNMTTKYQTFISCTSIPNTNLNYNKIEVKNGKVIN